MDIIQQRKCADGAADRFQRALMTFCMQSSMRLRHDLSLAAPTLQARRTWRAISFRCVLSTRTTVALCVGCSQLVGGNAR